MSARAATLDPSTEAMRLRAELTGCQRVLAKQRMLLAARADALALVRAALADVAMLADRWADHAPLSSAALELPARDLRRAVALLDPEQAAESEAPDAAH